MYGRWALTRTATATVRHAFSGINTGALVGLFPNGGVFFNDWGQSGALSRKRQAGFQKSMLTTSPPALDPKACQVAMSTESGAKRTDPSMNRTFTPPGW
jgi:hypothetical protein